MYAQHLLKLMIVNGVNHNWCWLDMYYVYRLLDRESNTVYVGRTRSLQGRIDSHLKGESHLPYKYILEVDKVEYKTFNSEIDMVLAEIYYISKYKPKFNKNMVYRGKSNTFHNSEEWKEYKVKGLSGYNKKVTIDDLENIKEIYSNIIKLYNKLDFAIGVTLNSNNVSDIKKELLNAIKKSKEDMVKRIDFTDEELEQLYKYYKFINQ